MSTYTYVHADIDEATIKVDDNNTATRKLHPLVMVKTVEGSHLYLFLTREKLTELVEKGGEWLAAHPIEDGAEAFDAARFPAA